MSPNQEHQSTGGDTVTTGIQEA